MGRETPDPVSDKKTDVATSLVVPRRVFRGRCDCGWTREENHADVRD